MSNAMLATLAALAAVLFVGWLVRSRARTKRLPGELRFPVGVLVLGLVATAFASVCAVLSYSAATGGPRVAAVFAGGALLGVVLIMFSLEQYRVSRAGLQYRTVLNRRGTAEWPLVDKVRWSPSLRWFVVSLRGRRAVRLSAMLAGLPDFANAVLENVPSERIEPRTLPVLRAAAAGDPPSPWS